MNQFEVLEKISNLKKRLGKRVFIPAHHYQNIDIIRISDFIGDSYQLALESSRTKADYIVLCGVRFMAESTALLAGDRQKILIPDMKAGCPMADMIDPVRAETVFKRITEFSRRKVVPVVYMNSYADMKSFTGEFGGSACTSSNARKILEYYLEQDCNIVFFPDFHLGRNMAFQLQLDPDEVAMIRSSQALESGGDLSSARLFLWEGYCPVHQAFTARDILELREKYPGIKVIVHPECDENVAKLADHIGSTDQIYKTIKASPDGSFWAVGTESSFIKRLEAEFTGKTVIHLRVASCVNMEKITLEKIADSLQSIIDYENSGEELKYEVLVGDDFKENARKSIEKMIEITEREP
jgi:quinolinate synthase